MCDECKAIICLIVVVGIVGMTAIIGSAVDSDREWVDALKSPVVAVDELQAYDSYTVNDSRDDLGVMELRTPSGPYRNLLVHLDTKTYNLVKGWGRVDYAGLKSISDRAGTVPPADKPQSLKR